MKDHRRWVEEGNPDICYNPACQEPRHYGKNLFLKFGNASRCARCDLYLQNNGEDDPNPRMGKSAEKHKEWVAQGNEDVYGTRRAPRPEKSWECGWYGWLDAARCGQCRQRIKFTKQDDEDWVAVHGVICAICGLGAAYTKVIYYCSDLRQILWELGLPMDGEKGVLCERVRYAIV
ncbi:hypothetical protein NM208_g11003 [Fusarium decemcellulare]|uniref:Uncharacterized protein n=1 Tax=Fusarium decemcellulare TaxID=57161 RepID=A0ACC1RVV2_9HYPO|nr:hypothetical protein NM208_g11003 [Fusarium decemcellulare]